MSKKIPAQNIEPGTQKLEVYGQDSKQADVSKTVELYESRKKIYVKKIAGLFQRIRKFSLWALMAMYFSICWISINGQQLVHFDLPARKFHIYGMTFWPQEFVLLALLLIICAYGLFFVTTLFGRVWCGYTCPQTSWTFIFMWIEEKVEGSRNQRMKLDKAEFSSEKMIKKTLKHTLWLLVSFGTGLTFVGYFYPIRELVPDLFTFSVVDAWAIFWIGFFTVATYLNAGWLREQVCLYMCPYARFQSVMFDEDTLVVSYDKGRGDPRGSRKRNVDYKEQGLGDCVDCGMCVQVCPTGIDIRDGLQYECIGCALCVDACDSIMDKMKYDRGLISYTTENALIGKKSHILRPKAIAYAVLLLGMMGAFAYSVATRVPLELDVIKDRGALYQLTGLGKIENTYILKVMNMSDEPHDFDITVKGIEGIKITTPTTVSVKAGEVYTQPTSIEVDPIHMEVTHYDIEITVKATDNPDLVASSESRFLGSAE
ncbi:MULTISPECIES: cytochrome c oxidase accessory protein CcoG [unclassified Oleiphilus]|jgi:cytochrome c oxidase accessory protein FixG|nr:MULTISPECIES: cytochrome c oxidase accessory protein CcoG [unclassified Oleiphilus]KZY40138.1 cytochrome c oxidase accessory protein CcoG [Oleiphilus sp. HI0050]KZY74126.1 cytochrome c oxidase accessory protein CcoG [Oleiphilus sp. HI0068]KZY77490.1 cytochrome c oxidase accessory protein CcoG [Oleiphilus sp. HI0069]KZZ06802.1 cytochrome c oxidase accessory protein CcoG [Oleiphilus sp. HI0078]KZY28495.1 cytochrome c oxidase accessory protein CcoG [Oleiphilus sp. HI0043]